tara:strand:- start:3621 stop:5402 length:1782 start_codon:yes stop_codon:yes gene_type:complete
MKENVNKLGLIEMFILLWNNLRLKRKKQLIVLFLVMFISGLAEIISISAVVPFLVTLTAPERIFEIVWLKKIFFAFGFTSSEQLFIPSTLIFLCAIVLSALIRLSNIWLNNRIAAAIGSDLSSAAFSKSLYQNYNKAINSNSSNLITAITYYISRTITVIELSLQFLTSLVIVFSLVVSLFLINVNVTLICIITFLISYLIISSKVRYKLSLNSQLITKASQKEVQVIQEGLGGIKDVLLNYSQETFINQYSRIDRKMRILQAQNNFLASSPRFILEALGLLIISIIAMILRINNEINTIIPTIGTFALGAQRLLPAMQACYSSWAAIKANNSSVEKVINIISQKIDESEIYKNKKQLDSFSELSVKNLYFKYNKKNKEVLTDINFYVKKGEHVGICGKTGCGKSTLIDLMMGLLKPSKGSILIDGEDIFDANFPLRIKQWRYSIANVPQNIFLSDSSFYENIAFGIKYEDIDLEKVKESAHKAQISEFIESTNMGYNTNVGERGILLSGGQRQRIGIARAFYKNAKIIFLDEATSALDNNTESNVMKSILDLNKDVTILIVAHRLSTLASCDKIIELKNGKISIHRSFDNLI